MKYCLIVAHDINRGIGKGGSLPWELKDDLSFFKKTTSGSIIVMGRKTWESLPIRPLPNRVNVVISSSIIDGVTTLKNFDDLDFYLSLLKHERVFFIGGTSIYKEALGRYKLDEIHITEIFSDFDCDTFLPEFSLSDYDITSTSGEKNGLFYRKKKYVLSSDPPHGEMAYLGLMREIMDKGLYTKDRTGVGTLELFEGKQLSFDLKDSFPLLTTKFTAFRVIAEELLFFLSGKTDNRILQSKKVKIWDGNSSREYLDSIGQVNRREGDLGKFYGFQWRHWGAEYVDCETDYTNAGFDQIAEVIKLIKLNPTSRRIIVSSWNPTDLGSVCLPPCHVLFQFYVNTRDSELSCHMYQRSADMFLGVPFNIASYALLTYLIAKTCDLTPKKLIITFGNSHVYLNHISAINEQLTRTPFEFPQLKIQVKRDRLEDYTLDDIKLINYLRYPAIKAEMAV